LYAFLKETIVHVHMSVCDLIPTSPVTHCLYLFIQFSCRTCPITCFELLTRCFFAFNGSDYASR